EITSTIAADGNLYVPHVVREEKAGGHPVALPYDYGTPWTGHPIIRTETAQQARKAMWAVVDYGTAWYGLSRNGRAVKDTGTHEGGKTGTAQLGSGIPQAWWIALAPDDQAPGGGPAKYVVVVSNERGGEGACQVFVADDIYSALLGI